MAGRLDTAFEMIVSSDRRFMPPAGTVAVTRRTTWIARMISAGPAVNAEARKRGPTIAEFQNGLPPKPTYRNAVTV